MSQGTKSKEYKGVVRGITVRSPTICQSILGGLKSIIGGQVTAYAEMCKKVGGRLMTCLSSMQERLEPTPLREVRFARS
jgi:uncharacterized protein YbjQ (UPF0145 family)